MLALAENENFAHIPLDIRMYMYMCMSMTMIHVHAVVHVRSACAMSMYVSVHRSHALSLQPSRTVIAAIAARLVNASLVPRSAPLCLLILRFLLSIHLKSDMPIQKG